MEKPDTARLKQSVDLRDLAERYTTLKKETAQEMSGPCPRSGCTAQTNGFHVTAEWFFCRQCHEKRGDAIEFVMWLEGDTFSEACERLGGGNFTTPEHKPTPAKPRAAARWDNDKWQGEAQQEIQNASKRLESDQGEPGRAYLEGRGILPETWQAWGLGYCFPVRHWKEGEAWRSEELGPAISLPWQGNGKVKALQYRLLAHPERRYHQKSGGDRTLFGAHLCQPAKHRTLIACEGELNAVSIWQAMRGTLADVVSWGPEDNAAHAAPYLARLAARYEAVIVWADKPEKALKALEIVGQATPLQSPGGMDANDLLQLGLLGGLLATIRLEADPDPARLQIELCAADDLATAGAVWEMSLGWATVQATHYQRAA